MSPMGEPVPEEASTLLAALVGASPDGMLALGLDERGGFRVAAVNDIAASLVGARRGDRLEDVWVLGGLSQELARVAETGDPLESGLDIGTLHLRLRATRAARWILIGLGTVAGRLRQEEEARRNAETRLTDAIERLRDGFILYDADDRVVQFNGRFRDYYQSLADELHPGMTFEELIRLAVQRGHIPLEGAEAEEWIQQRLKEHRHLIGPTERRLPDGRRIRISEHRTAEGGIVALGVDITDIKASEDRLRDLIEGSVQGILIHRGYTPLFANASYAAIYGFPCPEAVTGAGDLALLVPEPGRERARANMDALMREGGSVNFAEVLAQRIDGSIIWTDVAMRRVNWIDGPALQSTVVDVTERVRSERALRSLARDLEQARNVAEAASLAKSRFLAVMSHELRTPMTGVIGMVDLLLGTDPTPDQRGYLETLRSSADSLLVVLNDILDFSKIEAGQLALERIPFRPGPLVDDIMRLFAPAARAKGVRLDWSLPARTPQLLGDPTRLRQVLTNLVGNAVKFTETGSIDVRMRDPVAEEGGWRLRVEVRDTGIGIPEEKRADLFEAFMQADASTTRRFGGTGLGLAICKRLVGMMGGEIGVESRVGAGSTFWFTVLLEGEAPSRAAREEASPLPAAPAGSGARVLLAEDNQVNRLLITTMLERMGHRAEAVENGLLAVEAALTGGFDLILMDLQMPEMDGEAAAQRIRGSGTAAAALPIVALTADALPEERDRHLKAALFDGYLTKPIDWPLLDRTIRRLALDQAAGE
ncbi:MAG TPA: ATP-binding protein [Azospirillaceae bacterium]|nr:ATP-binding protein [Azospirillaceae bacterium]